MSGFELERVISLMDRSSDQRNREVLSYIKSHRDTILATLERDGVAEVKVSSGETFKIRSAA